MAQGHCANVVASIMMFVAALSGTIAISTPWFSDDSGLITWSLWQQEVRLFGTHKAKHDDLCKPSDLSDTAKEYCNKIKAARGTTIGTIFLGMLGTVALACEYCTHRTLLLNCSVIIVVLTFGSAGAAMFLGVQLANINANLTTPVVGFIMICIATLMAAMALVATMVAACDSPAGDEGGFKQSGGTNWSKLQGTGAGFLPRCDVPCCVKSSPPETCEQVDELFMALKFTKTCLLQVYHIFHALRQSETEKVIKTAGEIQIDSIFELLHDRRRWVERLLKGLLQLGGVEGETLEWNQFLYILLRFCSLNRVELCQTLFLIILKDVKSKVHHYVTFNQLLDFYSFYAKCPVTSFNTRAIDFTRLPQRRYYVEDFTEVVLRFTVLLNPIIHLQRSLQEFLPSITFWDRFNRTEVVNRKIGQDFFLIEKKRCFLWGEPPFRESCEMLAPEALGFDAMNKDQWDMRTYDLHERIGAMTEAGATKDGLVAPPGFQYRSLRQYSVWGEQPSPEETEAMMYMGDENTYMTSAGYITQHVDPLASMKEHGDAKEDVHPGGSHEKNQEKKHKKKVRMAVPEAERIGNPLNDPDWLSKIGACTDEEYNAPIDILPPLWMNKYTVAPAPRQLGPDRPIQPNYAPGTNPTLWTNTAAQTRGSRPLFTEF